MHVKISIDFEHYNVEIKDTIKRGEIWMSLITCGSIHDGHEWFGDYSRGRQKIFMRLAVPLCE